MSDNLFIISRQVSYKCPNCASTDSFTVEVESPVTLTIDTKGDVIDEEPCGTGEWFGTDLMTCEHCGFETCAQHFRVEIVTLSGLPMVIEEKP